jgi:hypothetical protein
MLNLECIQVNTRDIRDSTLKEWQVKIHNTELIHLLEGKLIISNNLFTIELCIHLIMELQDLIWCLLDKWVTIHLIIHTWVLLKACHITWAWHPQAVVVTWVAPPITRWCNLNNNSSSPKEQETNLLSLLTSRTWPRRFQPRTIWILKSKRFSHSWLTSSLRILLSSLANSRNTAAPRSWRRTMSSSLSSAYITYRYPRSL